MAENERAIRVERQLLDKRETYDDITSDPIFFPDSPRIEAFDDEVCSFMSTTAGLIDITI